jgi:hypothetical protein
VGMFKKLKSMTGSPSQDLLQNGLLGRGAIVNVQETGVSVGHGDMDPHRVCVFTVEVTLDNQDPYEASCRQAVRLEQLPLFQPGKTLVAVRVNPNDPQEIALDLNTEPPSVTVKRDPGHASAADILANGTDCRAVIIESQDYNAKSPEGVEIYAFTLTVIVEGRAPYQITVGNPVPDEAIPLLYPGNNLPAKKGSGGDNEVVIDWKGALASFTDKKS